MPRGNLNARFPATPRQPLALAEHFSATTRATQFERALALGTSSGVCAANDSREQQRMFIPAVRARNPSNSADYQSDVALANRLAPLLQNESNQEARYLLQTPSPN
jgi:hypothetical protein